MIMNSESILFADNDERFLRIRSEFLMRAGYNVIKVSSPEETRQVLREDSVALAILDIRLRDDSDDRDTSGLEIAREMAPGVPKIMLTGFPTWEAVRDALGPRVGDGPPAVDFIHKQEGPQALLLAVDWTLRQPQLKANIMREFEIQSLMALPPLLVDLGPEEGALRLKRSLDVTALQLSQHREREDRRASRYHLWGLVMAIMGMVLILVVTLSALIDNTAPATLPLFVSAICEAAGILFFRREDAAHRRIKMYWLRLNETNDLGMLLRVTDTLPTVESREEYKKKIINGALRKWFGE